MKDVQGDKFYCKIVIDGNNLLHAMHEHAPKPNVGRETLVRILEQWAKTQPAAVTVVFDGAAPQGPFARQLASRHIHICFAAPKSADDVIVKMIDAAKNSPSLRIVTADTAILYEARRRRCSHMLPVDFIAELFAHRGSDQSGAVQDSEPLNDSAAEKDVLSKELIDLCGGEDDPFDGFDAMIR